MIRQPPHPVRVHAAVSTAKAITHLQKVAPNKGRIRAERVPTEAHASKLAGIDELIGNLPLGAHEYESDGSHHEDTQDEPFIWLTP